MKYIRYIVLWVTALLACSPLATAQPQGCVHVSFYMPGGDRKVVLTWNEDVSRLPNGTQTFYMAGGDRRVVVEWGPTVTPQPDGSQSFVMFDGDMRVVVDWNEDVTAQPNGTQTFYMGGGDRRVVVEWDEDVTAQADGTQTFYMGGGDRRVVVEWGVTVTSQPDGTQTFTMIDGDKRVVVEWNEDVIVIPYFSTLTLAVSDPSDGSVTVPVIPDGVIDNGDGTYTIPWGVCVTAQATPAAGHFLGGWSDGTWSNDDNTNTICMDDGDKTVTAIFAVDRERNTVTIGWNDDDKGSVEITEVSETEPEPDPEPELPGGFDDNGASRARFTIGPDRAVRFSKGNMQYQSLTHTWRFAEHQYDFVGGTDYDGNPWGTVYENNLKSSNELIDPNNPGWIDLFSWGCSGWNSGAVVYEPDEVITSSWDDYKKCFIGGKWYNEPVGDFAEADWAYHNAIVGGGNQPHMWRTMTEDEWAYLFNDREGAAEKYGLATVADVKGLVILPDEWTLPDGLAFSNAYGGYTDNTYTEEQWTEMEDAGALFLPAAGSRWTTQWQNYTAGYYYTTTDGDAANGTNASNMRFSAYGLTSYDGLTRSQGASIRPILIEAEPQATFTPTSSEAFDANGAGNHTFSVGHGKLARFGKGNLQYQASTGTFRMATNQYDFVGGEMPNIYYTCGNVYEGGERCSNNLVSPTYSGWIDLFNWGCSGWNGSGAVEYQPYATSNNTTDYYVGGDIHHNLTGDYADADIAYHNAISNGGNQAHLWRMLTTEEWDYLFRGRPDARNKFATGRVDTVCGLIILPDDWILPFGLTFKSSANYVWSSGHDRYGSNHYSIEQWAQMEAAGAIFLPAAGWRRNGSNISYSGSSMAWDDEGYGVNGFYMSTTHYFEKTGTTGNIYGPYFDNGILQSIHTPKSRVVGISVRPVMVIEPTRGVAESAENIEGADEAGNTPAPAKSAPEPLIIDNGDGTYSVKNGTWLKLKATPTAGNRLAEWSNGTEVNSTGTLIIQVNEDMDLSATFVSKSHPEVITYTLTLATNDEALGSVTLQGSPEGVTAHGDGTYSVVDGTTVTVYAVPAGVTSYLESWSNSAAVNGNGTQTITVTDRTTLTATFGGTVPQQFVVTVQPSDHGSVTGDGEYTEGESVTLTATPDCGYLFSEWSDGNGDNPRIFTITQSGTYSAVFEAVTEFDAVAPGGQTLHYTINNDGTTVTVSGHGDNTVGALVIPDEVTYCENSYTVTAIGDGALANCVGITTLTIPTSITAIGEAAFANCSGLTEITAEPATAPTAGAGAFNGVTTTIPVHILCGSKASYEAAWGYFSNYSQQCTATLTVYDGTTTNNKIPAYVFYFDDFTRSQHIIPATDLEDMVGGEITSVTYYTTSAYIPYTTASTADVYLTEVGYTTLSDYVAKANATVVYSGTLDFVSEGNGGTLTITFTTPYTYEGGNLLVGIENTTNAGYKNIYYYGQTVSGASGAGSNGSSTAAVTFGQQNFIPKSTFTYTPAATSCEKPSAVDVTSMGTHDATIIWAGGSGTYNVEYKKAAESDWTAFLGNTTETSATLAGLDANTDYQVRVQSVCTGEPSQWKMASFSTLLACPAPTGLAATLTPGDGTVAALSWTAGDAETTWQLCLDGDEENLITVTDNPYQFAGLTPEQAYTAKVRAYCDEVDQSLWSNSISFTPTDAVSITVNDGLSTSAYVPIYGYWCDNITKSQFILPATDLAAVQNGTINKLTFYSSNANVSWGAAKFEVYMTETDATTMSALVDYGSMTKVKNAGTLAISGNKMVVTLDAPYQYSGGNLMIGFLQTVSGSYSSCSWYGVDATGASMGGHGTTVSVQNFLPKTTIDFTPGEAPTCPEPTDLAASDVTAHSATLSWTENGEATEWVVAYRWGSEYTETTVSVNSFVLDGLDPETTYYAKVRPVCSDPTVVDRWSDETSFTTAEACPAPTDLTAGTPDVTSVELSWTENGEATEWVVVYKAEDEEVFSEEIVTDNPYTLEDLYDNTTYQVLVRANCGDIDGESEWSDMIEFTTASKCLSVTSLTVGELTTTSVTLNWNDPNTGSNTFTVKNGDVVLESAWTETTYTVDGLTPNTDYAFSVAVNCGAGTSSPTTTTVSTQCGDFQLPYETGFENNDLSRRCWTIFSNSTANQGGLGFYTVNGRRMLRFYSYNNADDYNQFAISPELESSADVPRMLVIKYSTYGNNDKVKFGYSTEASTDTNDYVWFPDWHSTSGKNNQATTTQQVPAGTKHVAIRYYGPCSFYAWIDSVTVRESNLYTVATEVSPAAAATAPEAMQDYEYNVAEIAVPTPNTGYHFAYWSGDGVTEENKTDEPLFISVIGNRTVTANYELNKYELTVNYKYADGTTAAPSHSESVDYNAPYSVTSPVITGYTADLTVVSGTMGTEAVTVEVTYSINSYDLTVNYKYADGTTAAPSHSESVEYNAPYSVTSPVITGYTADLTAVSGTMGTEAVTVEVTYTINSYTITATPKVAGTGFVYGGGTYNHGATVTIAAIPAGVCYQFTNWTEGGEVVSTDATYSFTATESRTLVANFDPKSIVLSDVAVSDVTPTGAVISWSCDNANVEYSITLEGGGNTVNYNSTGSPLTLTGLTPSTSYTATVTATCGSAGSSWSGLQFTTPAEAGLSWSADEFTGYTMVDFNNWRPTLDNPHNVSVRYGCAEGSDVDNGGAVVDAATGAIGSVNQMYSVLGTIQSKPGTFHIYAVHDADADYIYDSVVYTLTVEPGVMMGLDKTPSAGGTVSFPDYSAEATSTAHYGTLMGRPAVAYASTLDMPVLAEPAEGYAFTGWEAVYSLTGSGSIVSTHASYTYPSPAPVSGEYLYVGLKAHFELVQHSISATANNSSMGFVYGGGTYNQGATVTLYAVPAGICNQFVNWTENGVEVSTSATYSFTATASRTLVANFEPKDLSISDLAVSDVTPTGAVISWSCENTYAEYSITLEGGGSTVDYNSTGSPLTLTGLTPGTDYTATVVASCGSATSEGDYTVDFSTPAAYTKDIEAYKWYAIASPVHNDGDDETLDGVVNLTEGAHDLYSYNEAAGSWEKATVLGRGAGCIYRRAADATLTFVGFDNSGATDVSVTAQCGDSELKGFNLVGNPYPHAIGYSEYYTLNANGTWAAHTAGTIGVAEAFLVHHSGSAYGEITLADAAPAKAAAAPAIVLAVSDGEFEDVAYAVFGEGDGLPKIGHLNDGAPTLSIPVAGRRYAIARMDGGTESFDVAFRGNRGEYTMTLTSHLSPLTYCHLIDRVACKDIDLLRQPAYTFSATGNDAGRFMVKLSPDALEDVHGNFAYRNGEAWVVEGSGTLQVYDVLGRKVAVHEIDSQFEIQKSEFPSTGVYVLRLGDKSQKIVVK